MNETHSSDRNLLFGLLAQINDFITTEQLLKAAKLWLDDKSRPLHDILRSQDALTDEELALLLPLVDRHIENHGGNPEASLAALSSMGTVVNELRGLEDADIDATLNLTSDIRQAMDSGTLGHVSTLDVRGQGTTSSSHRPDADPLRFRILRFHASGNLGMVSLAKDNELHREVALKQIKGKFADIAEAKTQFLVEAEITGGLEHPNIVPVYGLGQDNQGQPFYAMKFIKGASLRDAIGQFHATEDPLEDYGAWSLGLRKLLKRFIDVCDAMHYAHNRGVLHRDLKPGNIMLGRYGETLVVDWGLAKPKNHDELGEDSDEPTLFPPSASGSSPERPGRAVGTPAFMPPEQAAGKPDEVGRWSDIYSLGATLFNLLTGQRPFKGDTLDEVLDKVKLGIFDPPTAIKQYVPRPLEAICLKAMAKNREDRYATAEAIGEDIERWLADEPVSAWREPWTYRARRWIRQHQLQVATTAAAVVVALLATIVANVLVRQEQKRTEANYHVAKQAIDDSFVLISEDTLLNEPGHAALRKQLLGGATTLYQRLLDNYESRPELRREANSTEFKLARIDELTDEFQAAIAKYQATLKQQLAQSEQNPHDAALLADCGRTWNAIGRAQDLSGDLPASDKAYRKAREYRQHAVDQAEGTEKIEYQRELANVIMNLGQAKLTRLHDGQNESPQEILGLLEESQEIRNQLLAAEASPDSVRRDAAKGLFNLAKYRLLQQKQLEAAAKECAQAIDIVDQLLADANSKIRIELQVLAGQCRRLAGDIASKEGNNAVAENELNQAVNIFTELSKNDPLILSYRRELAGAQLNLADCLRRREKYELASTAINQAVRALEALAGAHQISPDVLLDRAAAYYLRGQIVGHTNLVSAYDDATKAIKVLRDPKNFSEEQTQTTPWQIHYARAELIAGDAARRTPHEHLTDEQREALTDEYREQCRQTARYHFNNIANAADSDQLDPLIRQNIALAAQELAKLSDPQDARALAEKSVAILKQISSQFPDNRVFQDDLGKAQEVLNSLPVDE